MSRETAKGLALYPQKRFFWGTVALLVVLILSIPPLLWFAGNWYVTPDAASYLLQGWHLISGRGFTSLGDVPQTRRGPGLPGLLGLLMLIFGRDVDVLAWTMRALALLNPWLAYFLIKRFSGPAAGLLAAALIALFGYTATLLQAFNIDAVMLTVYLLALLALLAAVERGGARLALLSGLLLGATIITKETAVASLPLGLMAALLLGWSLRGLFWHYAGVILVCLPWWVWVWSVNGEIYLVGKLPAGLIYPVLAASAALMVFAVLLYRSGVPRRLLGSARGRRWAILGLTVAWVLALSALLLKTNSALLPHTFGDVQSYVTGFLLRDTPLWPLLILAGIYVALKAVRGNQLWQFYVVVLSLQVPASLLVFVLGYNPRQYMVPQTFLLGALAVLVVELCRAVARRQATQHTWLEIPIAFALVSFLLVGTVFQVRDLTAKTEAAADPGRSYYLGDHNNRYVRDMHDWVSRNVPDDENVLATKLYLGQLAFLDGSKHEWKSLEITCRTGSLAPGVTGCTPGKEVFLNPPNPAVWFQIPPRQMAGSRKENQCSAFALSLPGLLNQMEQSNSEYLMLTPDWQYPGVLGWAPYLADSDAFKIVHATPTSRDKNTGILVGLILLKRTGEPAKAMPTRMAPRTVLQLVRCERQKAGVRYAKEIRDSFPNGIELDTHSVIDPRPDAEAQLEARARKVIERIYRSNGK
ncbi:MAG: glycosyltransferase family 39 protein [Rubrobacteraceae bacterium]